MADPAADQSPSAGLADRGGGRLGGSLALPQGTYAHRVIWHGSVFAVVALYAWYFVRLRYALNGEFPLATLTALAEGTAYIPFQFRALVPWMAGWLASSGACSLLTAYMVIEGLSVVGLFYALRYLVRDQVCGPAHDGVAFLGLYALPWTYILPRDIPIILPYDLTSVAFFALGLALLREGRWGWFYPLFVIGTVNRETMIFLWVVFLIVEWGRSPKSRLAVHSVSMLGLWIGVKFLLYAAYGSNPGSALEVFHVGTQITHLSTNLEMLISPERLLVILSTFGFLWVPVILLYSRIRDHFARRALWVAPLYVLMIIMVGNMNEVRVFGEMLGVAVLGGACIFAGARDGRADGRTTPNIP